MDALPSVWRRDPGRQAVLSETAASRWRRFAPHVVRNSSPASRSAVTAGHRSVLRLLRSPPQRSRSQRPRLRPAVSASTTELRHVSVLFCDLVGFTPFSEKRDPEEVREVLSGYFELARAIVGRYGGIVEKFIGDAVMAVWGAPVAKEDDAERAVRAGLELVSAVAAYGIRARRPISRPGSGS